MVSRIYIAIFFLLLMGIQIGSASRIPLSGDEVGVGMLQAAGRAFEHQLAEEDFFSLQQLEERINATADYGLSDVFQSLKKSGMHPPLYYILIHGWMHVFHTEVLPLRLLAYGFFLLSLLVLFAFRSQFSNPRWVIGGAVLLGLSQYGFVWGVHVRPYTLAMFFAVVSLALWHRIATDFRNFYRLRILLGYLAVVICGMYTIYHFVFVIAAQWLYLVAQNARRPRNLLHLLLFALAALLAYAPWIPYAMQHFNRVSGRSYYFHGESSPQTLFERFVSYNFYDSIPFEVVGHLAPAIAFMIAVAILAGLVLMLKNRETRHMGCLCVLYAALYLVVESIFDMRTLRFAKFLFFFMPLTFLAISMATFGSPWIWFRRVSVGLISILLVMNSAFALQNPSRFDGPSYLTAFAVKAARTNPSGGRALLVISSAQRRYLFPTVQVLHGDWDVAIWGKHSNARKKIKKLRSRFGAGYDSVLILNLTIPYEPESHITSQELKAIRSALGKQGFQLHNQGALPGARAIYFTYHASPPS